METITIEKNVKFDSEIDSIDIINVNDELRYILKDDETHATGVIELSGIVNTLIGKKEFNEEVDVDIYAPFEKKLDKENFKLRVKDYSYVVKNNNLTIYLVLNLEGIIDEEDDNSKSLLDEMNTLNVINDNNELLREEIIDHTEEVKIIEEVKEVKQENLNIINNNVKEEINHNWSKDLFKLNDSYVIFHKFKIK